MGSPRSGHPVGVARRAPPRQGQYQTRHDPVQRRKRVKPIALRSEQHDVVITHVPIRARAELR